MLGGLRINKLTCVTLYEEEESPSQVHFQGIDALATRLPGQADFQGRRTERVQTAQSCRIDEHGQLPEALRGYLLQWQG